LKLPERDSLTSAGRWTFADAVDFQILLATPVSDSASPEDLCEALAAIGWKGNAPVDKQTGLRAWLELQRRRGEPGPGRSIGTAIKLISKALTGVGALLGVSVAGTWLASAGTEPVNAPLFWTATVGLQLLLLAAVGLGWLRMRLAGTGQTLRVAVERLIARTAVMLNRLPGEKRDALKAALGRLTMRRQRHGSLLALPAVAITQRFAIAFNAGLLVAMVAVHLPLVELRFGWQSTYPIDARQMHRVVSIVGMPWQWAWPQAVPTLEQVSATRYARGQPAASLSAQASAAWWPFLAMSVLVYGLGLRSILLMLVRMNERRQLARWPLDDADSNRLWRLLSGPLIASEGGLAQLPPSSGDAGSHAHAAGSCALLVSDEMSLDDQALADAVRARFGWRVSDSRMVTIDDRSASASAIERAASSRPVPSALVIVAPAQREPIIAIVLFLKAVLAAVQRGTEVLLLLTESHPDRISIWRRVLQIHRLPIGVEGLT
jgi:hypothetical protein